MVAQFHIVAPDVRDTRADALRHLRSRPLDVRGAPAGATAPSYPGRKLIAEKVELMARATQRSGIVVLLRVPDFLSNLRQANPVLGNRLRVERFARVAEITRCIQAVGPRLS